MQSKDGEGERVRKVESRFVREDEMPERARMESREELYQLLGEWVAHNMAL